MTKNKLHEPIEKTIEQKLSEPMHNPDQGMALKNDVRKRLRRSFAAEERGESGITSEELAKRLGIRTF